MYECNLKFCFSIKLYCDTMLLQCKYRFLFAMHFCVGVSYFIYYICIYLRILFSPHDFHIRQEEVTKGLTKSSTSKTDNAMAKTKDHTDP